MQMMNLLQLPLTASIKDVENLTIEDWHDGYDEDFFGDDSDEEYLENLPELERENIINDRRIKRQEGQRKTQVMRKAKAEVLDRMRAISKYLPQTPQGGVEPSSKQPRRASSDLSSESDDSASSDASDSRPFGGRGRRKKTLRRNRKPAAGRRKAYSSDESGPSDSDSDASAVLSPSSESERSDASDGDLDSEESDFDSESNEPRGKKGRGKEGNEAALSRRTLAQQRARKQAFLDHGVDSGEEAGFDPSDLSSRGRHSMRQVDIQALKRGIRTSNYRSSTAAAETYYSDEDDVGQWDDTNELTRAQATPIPAAGVSIPGLSSPAAASSALPLVRPNFLLTSVTKFLPSSGPDLTPASTDDINSIRLTRVQLLNVLHLPNMTEAVRGLYIRVIDTSASAASGEPTRYRVFRIVEKVRQQKLYDPWGLDAKKNESDPRGVDIALIAKDVASVVRQTDHALSVAIGSDSKYVDRKGNKCPRIVLFTQVSNSRITDEEWEAYKQRLHQNKLRRIRGVYGEHVREEEMNDPKYRLEDEEDEVPTKHHIKLLADQFQNATTNSTVTDADIEMRIARKEKREIFKLIRTLPNLDLHLVKYRNRLAAQETKKATLPTPPSELEEKLSTSRGCIAVLKFLQSGAQQNNQAALTKAGLFPVQAALVSRMEQRQLESRARILEDYEFFRSVIEAIEAEEARRQQKHTSAAETNDKRKYSTSRNSSHANRVFAKKNELRMHHAAEQERYNTGLDEDAMAEDNPFMRRRSIPTNMFKIVSKRNAQNNAGKEGAKPTASGESTSSASAGLTIAAPADSATAAPKNDGSQELMEDFDDLLAPHDEELAKAERLAALRASKDILSPAPGVTNGTPVVALPGGMASPAAVTPGGGTTSSSSPDALQSPTMNPSLTASMESFSIDQIIGNLQSNIPIAKTSPISSTAAAPGPKKGISLSAFLSKHNL